MPENPEKSRTRTDGPRPPAGSAASPTGPGDRLLKLAILATAYCVTGGIGLLLAYPPGYATAVWPPSGIALAAVLCWGPRMWPGIWIGSLLVNLWVAPPASRAGIDAADAAVAASIATGSTLQALLAGAALRKWIGAERIFDSGPSVLAFTAIETLCCLLAPTWGVGSLWIAGVVHPGNWYDSWRTWWLGDLIGVLVVVPVLLAGRQLLQVGLRPRRIVEAVGSLALLTGATAFVFFGRPGIGAYPLSFLPLPFLVWIACRFEPGAVALGTLIVSTLAATSPEAGGVGGVAAPGHDALLLLQGFVGLSTIMALTLAAAVSGHKRSAESLRALTSELERLSLTDELTGIRNRRGFLLLGGQGWRLAQRTGSRCLLVFVDLDGLKRVNDTHGHQSGDALIVEAARVLTRVFRETDVVARLGGDEFAVLAVVDDAESSVAVSRRLQEALAAANRDTRLVAPLSMSFGIEELPATDDMPLESFVSRADSAMYDQKRRLAQRV